MMTDPIADMLTRIRNAVRVERPSVEMPLSKVKLPERSNKGRYDDQADLKRVKFVGERY